MISIKYKTIKDNKASFLNYPKPGSWINIFDPSEKEIEFLKKIGIDFSLIDDALDPDELSRIEKERKNVYVILNFPQKESGKFFNVPLLTAITPDYFITVSRKDLDCFGQISENPTTQKVKNFIQLCLFATNCYTKEIRKINKEINAKKVSLSALQNKDIAAFVELEEGLNEFITSNVAQIGVFEKIRSGKFVKVFEKDEDLLEDLIIDSSQSLDMCNTSIKKIINIRESYSAILTNNLNKAMKLLASMAIILGVPTIISSFYGMNVGLPLGKNPLAFLYVAVFSIAICLVLAVVFYFKKWL